MPAYESSPYLTELTTRILSTGTEEECPFAVLADTILYPEGGGQPSDRGDLNGVAVVDVRSVEDEVRHYLAEPVEAGDALLTLDWERRYDHMQQHTAQHLLSALALERFGWSTTSFHLGEQRSDIELDRADAEIGAEELRDLEERTMEVVRAARPVTARRISAAEYQSLDVRSRGLPEGHEGDVRLVEIAGIDTTTCGGTHLGSTAEIESIHLGPTERLRGGVRLYWIAGGRVRRRLLELDGRIGELRQLFETSEAELAEAAASKLAALKLSDREGRRLRGELAEAQAAALAARPEAVVEAHFEGADGGFLQGLARRLLEEAPAKVALLTATNDKGSFFVVAAGEASGAQAGEIGPRVAQAFEGRGGGSGTLFQGKAGSLDRRADALAALGR
jgi:Ser-tRNA(Ala) deacylase AlaX